MGWANFHIEKLLKGETVEFRPKGNSMTPKIKSGDLVTVRPITNDDYPTVGDIVLCTVKGKQFLHLISAMKDGQFQISNNHNHVNGWITRKQIYGVVFEIQR